LRPHETQGDEHLRTGDNVTRLVPATAKEAGTEISDGRLSFEDNRIAGLVFGHFDQNLTQIERRLGIVAVANGNEVSLKGPTGAMERTGRQFMGCVVGDHSKTAIGTRIMTGTTIGTGAMIACSVPPPSCTPRFAWLTDDGQKVHRLDRFLSTAEIVMKRRGESLQPAERAAIQALHARAVGNAS
jgi:hypothetical protein